MASETAITMVDTNNVLKFFGEKLNAMIEGFKENEIWLKEIQEEAKVMFISGFNAEPELMPKTPSERKRRRRRSSKVQDPNKRFSRSRMSLRCSSVQRIKLRNKVFKEDNMHTKVVEKTQRAAKSTSEETEKISVSYVAPINGRVPLVDTSLNDCKCTELYQKAQMTFVNQTLQNVECVNLLQKADETKLPPQDGMVSESLTPAATVLNRDGSNHETNKLKISADAAKESVLGESSSALCELNNAPPDEVSIAEEDSNKSVRSSRRKSHRLMQKSIAGRRSSCVRLMDLLNVQQTTMAQKSTRKSLRKSVGRRKNITQLSSASSRHGSIEKMNDVKNECAEAISSPVLEPEQPEEKLPAALSPEKDYRNSQNATEIAISNFENMEVVAGGSNSDKLNSVKQTEGCKSSCKNGVESISSDSGKLNSEDFPPRGTAPPLCSASKVIPSKNKSFLHTVQNNQLLMSPVAVGRAMKSFIKRKPLVKVDPKEKEMIRLANLKKKQEQEEIIQKLEEEKKRKLEEIKKKRELRLKRVFEARSQVEQQEKKKNKNEQKVSRTDKNEKLNEERVAEERAKKKLAVKKMEGESRRWQKEDTKQRLLQGEHQEMQQKEEELQQQCHVTKIKKLSEERESEQERERQHDVHRGAEKELERKEKESFLSEKEYECQAKKTFIQLPQDLEQTTLTQPQKESFSKGVQEKERVWEEQQLGEPQSQCFKREKTQREQLEHDRQEESKYEDQEIKLKKEQVRKVGEVVSNENILDKTVEQLPDSESDTTTPSTYSKVKLPKINLDNYGMDLNSDDSTDDEQMPRKLIPAWAHDKELQQPLMKQYDHPLNFDKFFGVIKNPNLEMIFDKRKPRYLKRTSSAVWHSPPGSNSLQNAYYDFVKY